MKKSLVTRIAHIPAYLILIISLSGCAENKNPQISVVADESTGTVASKGLTGLTEALQAKGITFEKVSNVEEATGETVIVAGLATGEGIAATLLKEANKKIPSVPEAITIFKTKAGKKIVWVISSSDELGLAYALFDVSQRIGWGESKKSPMSEVREVTEQPDVSVRTVTLYTMNRAWWEKRFYDEAYWDRYLDMLVKSRFNSMMVIFGYETGGFLAPCYPYFFNVDEFPGVKMTSISPEQQERNLKALNKLISMAHDHGIRFTVGIWDHIYRGGVQAIGLAKPVDDSKPDPVPVIGLTGENLIPYTRTALTKFIKLVPELDAVQFRMHNESGITREEQNDFWLNLFQEMKKESPDLNLDLRAKEISPAVIQSAIDVGMNFRITTKYWMEQMGMPWHPTRINPERSPIRHSYDGLLVYPQQYKMIWTLWTGGTARILLWGDPGYVRRFAETTHLYNDVGGFEVNEPLSTKMHGQPHDDVPFELLNSQYRYYDYEFERYWHFFQVFGRIGYNPNTPSEVWEEEFERRFGEKTGEILEEAIHKASWILPRIVSCSYPYSHFPTTLGWPEKMSLGSLPVFARAEGSDLCQFATFDEEAKIFAEGGETAKILPSMSSKWFEEISAEIDELIAKAERAAGRDPGKEFVSTITDLKILSSMALYHSRRIPAAVSYRLYYRTRDLSVLDEAIAYEKNAIDAWRRLVDSAGDVYASSLKFGPESKGLSGHWKDELANLEKGLIELEKERAEFKAENEVKPASHFKTADRSDNSILFKFKHIPVTSLETGKPLTVSVKVSTKSGIKWVRLQSRSMNQDLPYQALDMLPGDEKDTYQVTVPADQINPRYDFMYYIEVMDNNGNGKIYPDMNKETPYVMVRLAR